MRRPQESVIAHILWGKSNRMKRTPSSQCEMSLRTPRAKRRLGFKLYLCGSLVSKVEESKTRGHFLENTAKGCGVYCRVTNINLTDPLETISRLLLLLLLHIGFFKNEQIQRFLKRDTKSIEQSE